MHFDSSLCPFHVCLGLRLFQHFNCSVSNRLPERAWLVEPLGGAPVAVELYFERKLEGCSWSIVC